MGVRMWGLDDFDTVCDCRHIIRATGREPITDCHSRGPAAEQPHRPNGGIPDRSNCGESNLQNVVLLCH